MPQQKNPLMTIISLIGVVYAIYLLLSTCLFIWTAQEVQGRVIDSNSATFTIEYEVDGRKMQIKEDLPRRGGLWAWQMREELRQPGKVVLVLYDPSSPEKAKWKNDRNWMFPVLLLFVFTLGLLGSLFPEVMFRPFR